jgi:hypothetical protein
MDGSTTYGTIRAAHRDHAIVPSSMDETYSIMPSPRICLHCRFASWMIASLAVAVASQASDVRGQGPLVTREMAASRGLERSWFAQVPVNPARNRVSTWYLYYDRLYSVTDSGVVTSLNAETGEQLWAVQVGRPGHAAFGPGANADHLGIVSGGKLYLLNRHTGRMKWIRELGSAPSSGPALSEDYAYVALMTGRIEGYRLDDPLLQPWYYQSNGRTYLRPTVTGSVVSWPTANGYLYVADADQPHVLFRLQTNADIVTSPAQQEPLLYIGSLDGYLYCVDEMTGREQWRYSTGHAIESSPAVVGDTTYVASFEPALHAIDSKTGAPKWVAPGVSHFAARGKDRVYGSDQFGNLMILDAATGRRLTTLPVAEGLTTLVNDQSDRVFLVNDRGLVQCLHDVGAEEPTLYRQPPAPPAAGSEAAAEEPPAPPAEGVTPARETVDEAPAEDSPFGVEEPADEEPADGEPMDDNPFEF